MGTPPPSPPNVSISCPGYDPVGTSRAFTATTDISCSIAIYFDSTLVISGSGTSLSYNAGAGTLGHHIVEARAWNEGGSNSAICNWYVYDPNSCEPLGPYLPFGIDKWKCGDGSWQNTDCIVNALLGWAIASADSSQYGVALERIKWKRTDSCPEYTFAQFSGGYNKEVYVVALTSYTNPGHALDAEYIGGHPGGYTNWANWKFFNYGNLNIQPNSPDIPITNINGQMPWTPSYGMTKTKIVIKRIIGITSGCDYQTDEEHPIVSFYLDDQGEASLNPNWA